MNSNLSYHGKRSNCAELRLGWVAGVLPLAVSLLVVVGVFAGTNALAATTYTVTTLNDTTGSCSGASCTTLRAAIAAANGSAGNTINFTGLTGTITLASALPAVTQDMTIAGPGASSLTISGNSEYQILYISSGTVTISGLNLANGSGLHATNGGGGAINNAGVLTVANTTFSANTNAAIANSGPLTVTDSTFSGNSGDYGGAISSYGAMMVTNCTFSGNTAVNGGGAIVSNITLNVTNSTFSGNSTTDAIAANGAYGGGAILSFGTSMAVTNSTFSGNSTPLWGGAIYAYGSFSPTFTASNNIFIGNSSSAQSTGAAITAFVGTSNANYNLFYQNLDGNGTEDDCNGCTSNTNAITGSNPNLLPLGNYGGPAQTMLPQPGSPAICAGSYADVPNGVTTDQRGFPLTSATCSNGGVDVGSVQTGYLQVTTTADSNDGSCSTSNCSLRDAITSANASGGDIDFAPGVTGTITLTSALPTISQSMLLMGPGAASLTVSGNNTYQILGITSGTTIISGLTFANGSSANASAGAIENSGTLMVTNSAFTGNSADDFGGAIENNNGTLTVNNSTFSGNDASSSGGALSSTGVLTVTNSTFSGNSGGFEAAGGGGAISNYGTLMTLTGNTFSANSGNYGGAVYNYGASAIVDNNIFTASSSQNGSGAGILDDSGTVNASYNLYYQNLDAGTTEDDCNKCSTNINSVTNNNPLLAALGNYGGPTQTMLPALGSPAICSGTSGLIPSGVTTDQRGFSRTTSYSGTACVDLGAVQTDYTAVSFSNANYSGVTNQNVNPAPVVTVTENGQNIGGVPLTLGYSGTGSLTGLGPVTTVGGTGATFSSLNASSAVQGTLTVNLPITASNNSVQPAALTASASLNIQLSTQTITFVAASPATYGYAPITLMATGGASGNPITFSLDTTSTPGAAMLSGSTLTILGVGTIVVDANQAGNSGYQAAPQVQQSILVNPASLTITASSPTVIYGSPVPTITPIFGTFFNGDTSAVLTKQPTCVTAYTPTSTVGSSPSTSCSGAAAVNYTFTYVNGSVTVNPAPTFVVGSGSASISIVPGATTGNTVPITVTPSNGFTGTVNLTCSVSPVAANNPPTCSLSPDSVVMTGTGAQTSTLTVSTTASTVAENEFKPLWPSAGTLALVLMIRISRRRRRWLTMLGALAISMALGAVGCGGGSGSSAGNSGTKPGTYTITVTGTSGSVTGAVGTVTLTVQ